MMDVLEYSVVFFFFSVNFSKFSHGTSLDSLASRGGPGVICNLKNVSLWSVTSIPKDVLGKDDVLDKDSIKHCNDGCPRIQRSFFFLFSYVRPVIIPHFVLCTGYGPFINYVGIYPNLP